MLKRKCPSVKLLIKLSAGVCLAVLVGCRAANPPLPVPTRLPRPEQRPSVNALPLRPDLSNLANGSKLPALRVPERALLGQRGMLVRAGDYREFFEAYINNDAPFITSDCLLHVYHVLTEDSLENCERLVLQPMMLGCVQAALPAVGQDREARGMLATLNCILDPTAPEGDSEEAAPTPPPPDELGYTPPTNRARPALVYASSRALYLDRDDQLRSALLLSYALAAQPGLWKEWVRILRWREWLAGKPEDLSPESLLALARPIYGQHLDLNDSARESALKRALSQWAPSRVVDQDADLRPRITFRLLPPGVTSKSLAFQKAVEERRLPGTEDIVKLLEQPSAGDDLHSITMGVLNGLNLLQHFGVVRPEMWAHKTHNAQLGSWAELEHALGGYTKDNNYYIGGYEIKYDFPGYVEPNPVFFRELAELTRHTREGMQAMGVFDCLDADVRKQAREYQVYLRRFAETSSMSKDCMPTQPSSASLARASHFTRLEMLLEQLAEMAELESEGRPLTSAQKSLLLKFPEDLKALSLIENNVDQPPEPMGQVAKILHDVPNQRTRYAAVGRPLELLVVAPYQGRLFWCRGSVYSFYQLDRPDQQPLSDRQWKACSVLSPSLLEEPAYLPVEQENWGEPEMRAWVDAHRKEDPFWGVYGGSDSLASEIRCPKGLSQLPPLTLTPAARQIAVAAFADPRMDYETSRPVLFHWLKDTSEAVPAALGGLRSALRELSDQDKLSSEPGRLWILLCLRILDGRVPPEGSELLNRGRVTTWGDD